jgi:hypothetical protein
LDANGGGALNTFGEDFFASDTMWTTSLCEKDSDGDGATNGEELGDPCCVWNPGDQPQTKANSSPGHKNLYTILQLASMKCNIIYPIPATTSRESFPTPAPSTPHSTSAKTDGPRSTPTNTDGPRSTPTKINGPPSTSSIADEPSRPCIPISTPSTVCLKPKYKVSMKQILKMFHNHCPTHIIKETIAEWIANARKPTRL